MLFLVPLLFVWNLKYYKNLLWPILYSLIVLIAIDNKLAEMRKESKIKYIITHVILLFVVVLSTNLIGQVLSKYN